MKYNKCAVLALVCLVCIAEVRSAAMPYPCLPDNIHRLPARIRRVCFALLTVTDLGKSMESYIVENAPTAFETNDLEAIPQRDTMKRQDVDHVFLRFGRRR